jgi:hypothetical protein
MDMDDISKNVIVSEEEIPEREFPVQQILRQLLQLFHLKIRKTRKPNAKQI